MGVAPFIMKDDCEKDDCVKDDSVGTGLDKQPIQLKTRKA